jgi:aminopeptidase N
MGQEAYKSFYLPESRPHYPPRREFHTEHVKIELVLDIERRRIAGSCTLLIVPLADGLRRVRLDASGMEIQSASIGGTPAEFEYDGEELVIHSTEELLGRTAVVVAYASSPRAGVHFVLPDKEHPAKELQAWTQSEAEFARHWFPCYDYPNDRSTSELVLTVQKGFTVISNGRLVSTEGDAKTATFHWKEDLPHPSYLNSFVAGRFDSIRQEADGLELDYYFPEAKRPDVLRYFGETPKMIKVFEDITGVKYPYVKYAQTTVEDFIFGGMENFNATTLAMTYYPDEKTEEDFQVSYASPSINAVNLVAHELAHQWFGDLVTCADWSHAWLNEGFATYMQAMYIERSRGTDEFRNDLDSRAAMYFEDDERRYRRPIVENNCVYPDDLFDSTTYEKGEWMLHELRRLVGEKAFLAGVSDYLKSHSLGNADTHDFRNSMEKVSGLSLQEFFDQAFFQPGYPSFDVDYQWDDLGRTATLRVRQVQSLDGRTPIFKVPCDIVFYVKGVRQRHVLTLDSKDQTLSFVLEERPSIVEFDPEHWLLKKVEFKKSVDLLVNQLERSEDASSRAEAAKSLGQLKSDQAVPALARASTRRQFWEVRARALRALGELGTDDALKAILEVEANERKVRRAKAEALGFFKDKRARDFLVRLLEEDESPYVRCEAALSLTKASPDGSLPVLKEAMNVASPNDTLTEACLEAMGRTKDGGANEVIADCVKYGKPTRVRIGAMKAMKVRGYLLPEEIPVLGEILRGDPDFRVRYYLVDGLLPPLGDSRLNEALKMASSTDRDPRVRRRALEVYYELIGKVETSTEIAKLKREIESLKERGGPSARGLQRTRPG